MRFTNHPRDNGSGGADGGDGVANTRYYSRI